MPETERPNVILICVDQWRGDCLSIDGHHTVHTPYLDELALAGARFRHAYTSVPSCIAARAGLHTGLSQETHGFVGYRHEVPWNFESTLAGEFTRHGYQTQSVGKMHVYPERSQVGFQNVILHDGYLHSTRRRYRDLTEVDDYLPWLRERAGSTADFSDHGVNANSIVARPWDKEESLHPTNYVATQSIDFLRRRDPRKPFFLFMSFHRPHPPYDPPAWAYEQYVDEPMPDPPVGDWAHIYAEMGHPNRPDTMSGKIDPRVLRRGRAGYYGHMTHIDHQIKRFMEALQGYGLKENTYVCFTSDHGEMMGDHNLFRKTVPYEGSARVPLILTGPRKSHISENHVADPVVELRDIMPTLLDCAGLPIPESVEGKSLLSAARGDNSPLRPYLHGEHTVGSQSLHWVTDGHAKFVWLSGDGHEQFFDLDADPQELRDLARDADAADRVARWRGYLVEALEGREEGFTEGDRLVPGRPVRSSLSSLIGPR